MFVNIGNSHTLVAAIRGHRVYGLFEHHTKVLNTELLASLVKKMQENKLTHEEIFDDAGYGAIASARHRTMLLHGSIFFEGLQAVLRRRFFSSEGTLASGCKIKRQGELLLVFLL